jgi:hypothetical protein
MYMSCRSLTLPYFFVEAIQDDLINVKYQEINVVFSGLYLRVCVYSHSQSHPHLYLINAVLYIIKLGNNH